jgi:hypothetical protein
LSSGLTDFIAYLKKLLGPVRKAPEIPSDAFHLQNLNPQRLHLVLPLGSRNIFTDLNHNMLEMDYRWVRLKACSSGAERQHP